MFFNLLLALFLFQFTSCIIDLRNYNVDSITRPQNQPYVINDTEFEIQFNFRKELEHTDKYEFDKCVAVVMSNISCMCHGNITNESLSLLPNNAGLRFDYSNTALSETRYATYNIICDKSEHFTSKIFGNTLILNIHHHGGCRLPDPLSFGSIGLIAITCLVFSYFSIGIPFMYFILKRRGIEVFPCVFFWVSIPMLVKAGLSVLFSPCISKKRDFAEIK